ncbi:VOC family protein [Metabacillus iocasae]|uniref:VOC family protein n=1 Tax=Priestia iocasae TaxID=2291674 RepID=UPI00196513D0|nr:VOC family protein [Metabacillus iocasae]
MNFHCPPAVFIKNVHLIVENLNRSLLFYRDVLGFKVLKETSQAAILTVDGETPILTIEQPEGVLPKPSRTTGLYHFALLLPNRHDLANMLTHLLQVEYPLQGASDHLVSEAIYLADPDGNGIEIYIDRPSNTWRWEDGELIMATEPLDGKGLLAERTETWKQIPHGTIMGHIHLHVSNLHEAESFYCDGLGFDVTTRYGDQALFLSSNGYHHHIGLNTWNGIGAPPAPKNSVGLKFSTLVFPTIVYREQVIERLEKIGATIKVKDNEIITKDPSGNAIRLIVE